MSPRTPNDQSTTLLENFARDGFVAVRSFFDGDDLDELLGHVNRFIAEVVPGMPPEHVFHEDRNDPSTLKQLQHMGDHDPWFHEIFTAGPFRKLAEILLRGPVVPKNMQFFNKPPGVGKPTPPHQDGYYFMLDPCEALTMWFALEEVDEENGCVRYVRGSHEFGMRDHSRTNTLGFSQGITDYPTQEDNAREIPIRASAGDLIAHDAMTIHRADGNRSPNRTRRALGFIYYGERAREDQEAHDAYQKKLADELKAVGKI